MCANHSTCLRRNCCKYLPPSLRHMKGHFTCLPRPLHSPHCGCALVALRNIPPYRRTRLAKACFLPLNTVYAYRYVAFALGHCLPLLFIYHLQLPRDRFRAGMGAAMLHTPLSACRAASSRHLPRAARLRLTPIPPADCWRRRALLNTYSLPYLRYNSFLAFGMFARHSAPYLPATTGHALHTRDAPWHCACFPHPCAGCRTPHLACLALAAPFFPSL